MLTELAKEQLKVIGVPWIYLSLEYLPMQIEAEEDLLQLPTRPFVASQFLEKDIARRSHAME